MVCVIIYFDSFTTKATYCISSPGTANRLEARRIQIWDKTARSQVHAYSSRNGSYTGSAGEMTMFNISGVLTSQWHTAHQDKSDQARPSEPRRTSQSYVPNGRGLSEGPTQILECS